MAEVWGREWQATTTQAGSLQILAWLYPFSLPEFTEASMDVSPADERGGERQEGLVHVGSALVTDREATEAAEPRQRALDDPPVPAQTLAAVDPASSDASFDPAPA